MRVLGLSAPGDLAVIGVDNVPLAPFASPPLSTVDIGVPVMAAAMSAALLQTIRGEQVVPVAITATLVVRRST
jgi:DNA-binding LacI/PurR family transcriptional regulator